MNNPNFNSGMPAFGGRLEDEEIQAVVDHLKSFWILGQREGQALASQSDPFP